MIGLKYIFAAMAISLTAPTVFAETRGHSLTDYSGEATFTKSTLALEDGTDAPLEIGFAQHSEDSTRGIILFAHGANLAPDGYRVLQERWIDAGYIVISPTFIDSESHPAREASDRALILRNRLDTFEQLAAKVQAELDSARKPSTEPTAGLLPPSALSRELPIFAAGHSYGAYIAQILAGASVLDPANGETHKLDRPRNLRGVIALSAPPAFDGFSPKGSWAGISVPMLSQSGPGDVSPPFVTDWRQHYDSHCDMVKSGSETQSFVAMYSATDHYFGGMIGRPTDSPSVKAQGDVRAFAVLSLIFMEEATSGDSNWPWLNRLSNALTDNRKMKPQFSCSHGG